MRTSESTKRATGTFDITSWDEEAYDERDGVTLGRARLAKTFHGDLTATSEVELLAVHVGGEGAAYVAVERVTGSLHGRRGGFVLTHAAGQAHGMTVAVVPGSATGELSGLTGAITIVRHEDGSHEYSLDYQHV
ncbi:MAG TPA: DUF3224 domain-containing protein [Actinophytocola sp.]|uniref:DUF3224 domain-containing protein n=1 Tax=Actinophytocola sp. TaxID=1872138 RepID=UPI002DDC9B99|nr:DUF3224 domain-containing protein [Actinophytocola sp.]HEV2778164.1 DUF3224 domain-containing protein [Actinophytocola sp.]